MEFMNYDCINLKFQGKRLFAMMGLLAKLLSLLTTMMCKFLQLKLRLQRLPPGPRGLPLLGNLFQFNRFFTSELQDLAKIYGPIITLHVGSTPFIIITDKQIAHEALVTKGAIFASRPSPRSFSRNHVTISTSVHGPVWRALRKNLVSGMITSNRASKFGYLMEECVQDLVKRFRDEAARNGGIVEARPIIRYGVFNLLLSLCFGKQAEESVVLGVAQILRKSLFRARKQLDASIAWVRFIPGINTKTKDAQELRQQQIDIILPLIKEAQRLREEGNLPSGSYIHSLLEIDDLQGEKLSDELLVTLCSEVLNAGTDTTVSALEWAIASIIIQPKIQTAIVQEIEKVVGKTAITEENIGKLPYLEAVVKETLRRHPPAYYTLPHAVTQPCKLRGYDIPLNARVFVSVSSISNDPSIWVDPTEFKPERFLNLDPDITGSKEITMIPFGAGRRICPGLGLAMLHLKCILARLMQSFEWSTSAPGEMVDLTGIPEFTMVMKTPLRVLIQPR